MSGFNGIDFLILGIFLLSMILGMTKGVVKEVLSLFTWIAAFIVASLFSSRLAAYFTNMPELQSVISTATNSVGINPAQPIGWLAFGISFIALFSVTMITGSLISTLISGAVNSIGLGIINRLLGGVFGLVRGLLVSIFIVFLMQMVPQIQQQPAWAQSFFVGAYQPAVQWLGTAIAPGVESLKSTIGEKLQNVNTQMQGVVNSYGGFGR